MRVGKMIPMRKMKQMVNKILLKAGLIAKKMVRNDWIFYLSSYI